MKKKARQQSIKKRLNGNGITVVVPTLNEEENLRHVLPRIPSIVKEVLIVDGNSDDKTVEVASSLCTNARVIYQSGKGKGDALKCGIQAASHQIVVTLDADGSTDPKEIPRFVEPLLEGYDFAKGSRFLKGGGTEDMPWHRRFGCKAFLLMVWMLYGRRYTDLPYGYNAFWKGSFNGIQFNSDGFAIETEIHLKVLRAGLKVAEVPSFEYKRKHGEGKLRSFSDGFKIAATILKERFRRSAATQDQGNEFRLQPGASCPYAEYNKISYSKDPASK
ncbi:glycosyltransferase family 2 protein [Chloroflexota bacterium]